MAESLKKSGLDCVGVSIDSPREEIHDGLRGVSGIFKRATQGIGYCKKYGIDCYISAYATRDNIKNGDLRNLIQLTKSLGVKIRILSSIRSGRLLGKRDAVLSTGDIAAMQNLLEKGVAYWETPFIDTKYMPFMCAARAKIHFYVTSSGDVQPCCYCPVSYGNVRNEPLRDIVVKMFSSDFFAGHRSFNDCPVNDDRLFDTYILPSISQSVGSRGQDVFTQKNSPCRR
jgi:MoaA/NifB/PqqE/SkfB family radical SAM enzyme